MTDLITGNLVEAPTSGAAQPGQLAFIDGRAIIAYESILDDGDVSLAATTEAAEFEVENLTDRLTYSAWQPSAGGTQYVTITAGSGKSVDYLGIAAHNLASKGATIDFEYSDDGVVWTSVLGGYVPITDAPLLLLFAQQQRQRFRLAVNVNGAALPTIGVLMLGERLSLQRGIFVGHRPAPFARKRRFLTEESDSGQIIGSVAIAKANETAAKISRITPSWYREFLDPFLERAVDREPFFFMWNTDDRYKGEVLYGVMTNEPEPVHDHQSFMEVTIEMRGLA